MFDDTEVYRRESSARELAERGTFIYEPEPDELVELPQMEPSTKADFFAE